MKRVTPPAWQRAQVRANLLRPSDRLLQRRTSALFEPGCDPYNTVDRPVSGSLIDWDPIHDDPPRPVTPPPHNPLTVCLGGFVPCVHDGCLECEAWREAHRESQLQRTIAGRRHGCPGHLSRLAMTTCPACWFDRPLEVTPRA